MVGIAAVTFYTFSFRVEVVTWQREIIRSGPSVCLGMRVQTLIRPASAATGDPTTRYSFLQSQYFTFEAINFPFESFVHSVVG